MADLNTNPAKVPEAKKGAPIGMIALSIILTAALVFLVVMYFDQKNKMIEMKTALTQEKDSLANELNKMALAYDTLKTDNDSLNAGIERQKERIVRLLAINASDIQLIKKYKAEIGTMREIMKSYIVQIDSLNTRNKILVAENTEIKQQITEVQNVNTELEKVRDALSEKVEVASIIQAKNISAAAVNKKNKETSRLNLMAKLRVGFTLRENPIALAGQKQVFLRVIRPDSLVIATSPDNLFEYNGNQIIYSASRTIDYMNQDIDVTIWVDNTGDFVPGNYNAEIYLDGVRIGKTTFLLTKR
jgi:FtsZ-binding cell division protein ZapB